MNQAIDWTVIKADYCCNGLSYGQLAKKYNLPLTTCKSRGQREKWNVDRVKEVRDVTSITVAQTLDCNKKMSALCEKLLDMMTDAVASGELTVKDSRLISGTMKDIREICGYKTELDIEEQKARIAKLIKETEDRTGASAAEYGVVQLPIVQALTFDEAGEA